MVASLGERKCVMGDHDIVGIVYLVPLLDEAGFEDPEVVTKGPCCNRHYKEFFAKHNRNKPLVHTLYTLLWYIYCVFLFVLGLLVPWV